MSAYQNVAANNGFQGTPGLGAWLEFLTFAEGGITLQPGGYYDLEGD